MKLPRRFSKQVSHASAAILFLALAVFSGQNTLAASDPTEVQLIVKPKLATSEVPLKAMLAAHGARQQGTVSEINARVVRVSAAQASQLLKGLQVHPNMEYAEVDAVAKVCGTANDSLFSSEWHLAKIQAPSAWDVTTGTSSVIVAVVDTGVNASHPDLAGKVLTTGWDFVANDSNATDENGHGTAVAGTIAPDANNHLGVVGVAWANPILPVRVLDASGAGNYSTIAQGIIWAADHGARIINLSLGGTASSTTLQNAITYAWNKQCIVVAAAGNNGNSVPVYPAACSNVVSVAATNASDTRTSWSNYGSYIDVCAPGENIVTLDGSNSYASWSGTSFSSPVTSGVLALMASVNPKLTNAQLVDLLLKNCDDLGTSGADIYYGNGRVNALRAVTAAKNFVAPDTTAPVATISSPTNKSTISGSISVSVQGADNIGVTRLELYLDTQLVAQSAGASATFSLNTLSYTNGTHTLQARAYDAAGNIGTASISVTIKNSIADTAAPTTAITLPVNGSKVSSTQKINATCTDNIGVTKLEVYLDGLLACTVTSSNMPSSVAFTWNTTTLTAGSHTLQTYAYDAAGNVGESAVVTVTK